MRECASSRWVSAHRRDRLFLSMAKKETPRSSRTRKVKWSNQNSTKNVFAKSPKRRAAFTFTWETARERCSNCSRKVLLKCKQPKLTSACRAGRSSATNGRLALPLSRWRYRSSSANASADARQFQRLRRARPSQARLP